MSVLLWWPLASVIVSVFVGAFLAHARHEPEILDLDLTSPERPEAPISSPVDSR